MKGLDAPGRVLRRLPLESGRQLVYIGMLLHGSPILTHLTRDMSANGISVDKPALDQHAIALE